ncbi:MAG: hypothetical protein QOF76_2472 [Solirubrobacteraceae bacterium]|jgi:quercetin dioxygenase-like cupin family protein|nr:hypothetical protein [Solirubrobacteraceae bacterium]
MNAKIVRIDDLERVDVADVHWRPLRRAIGVTAFKTNAYSADTGERLLEEHDEKSSGQEEMYVMVAGAAAFTVDDETVEVAAGGVVFYPNPATRRGAVATADGSIAVAVGGNPGAAGPPSAWEYYFAADAVSVAGDPARAYEMAAEGLGDHPDSAGLHYNLACYAALTDRRELAVEHWRKAKESDPRVVDWAAEDTDLDAIRDEL